TVKDLDGGLVEPGDKIEFSLTLEPLHDREMTLIIEAAQGLDRVAVRQWSGCTTLFRVTEENRLEAIVAKVSETDHPSSFGISWYSRVKPEVKHGSTIKQLVYAVTSPDSRPLVQVPKEEWLSSVGTSTLVVGKTYKR
ncbi:MAG: hypothetical protein V1895_00760, partial [Parcubacteria group bacterium]